MSSFLAFMDMPSFLVVLCADGLMLGTGGQLKSFLRAFGYFVGLQKNGDEDDYEQELRNSYDAVKYAMKSFLFIGGLIFLVGAVAILSRISEPGTLGKNFAVASLGMFYCLIFDAILLPISGILKKKIAQC